MRTYRGNSVDRDDEGEIRNAIGEEHLPESTSTTGDYEPQAADGREEDDQVEGHRCPGLIREGGMARRKDALSLYMYNDLRTAGDAPVTTHSPNWGAHSALT